MAVMSIARETGWTERYILEELPLSRFLLYKHVLHWKAGDWTVPPDAPVDTQLKALGV
jgi:hypothetical protein